MEENIRKFGQLSALQQEAFTDIFMEGFGHLLNFKKDAGKYRVLLAQSFHPSNSHAFIKNEQVVGVMLLATNKLRPLKCDEAAARELFGAFKGRILCKQMNGAFQSKVVEADTDLYIDMLAVSDKAKRQGVGAALLDFAFSLPGFHDYYLEVLSKNAGAKRLYEKIGFREIKRGYFSPLRLLGYGYPIKMKKQGLQGGAL